MCGDASAAVLCTASDMTQRNRRGFVRGVCGMGPLTILETTIALESWGTGPWTFLIGGRVAVRDALWGSPGFLLVTLTPLVQWPT